MVTAKEILRQAKAVYDLVRNGGDSITPENAYSFIIEHGSFTHNIPNPDKRIREHYTVEVWKDATNRDSRKFEFVADITDSADIRMDSAEHLIEIEGRWLRAEDIEKTTEALMEAGA